MVALGHVLGKTLSAPRDVAIEQIGSASTTVQTVEAHQLDTSMLLPKHLQSEVKTVAADWSTMRSRSEFLMRLTKMNSDQLAAMVDELLHGYDLGTATEQMFDAIFYRWGEEDPGAAVAMLSKIVRTGKTPWISNTLEAAARGLGASCARTAESREILLSSLANHPHQDERESVIDALFEHLPVTSSYDYSNLTTALLEKLPQEDRERRRQAMLNDVDNRIDRFDNVKSDPESKAIRFENGQSSADFISEWAEQDPEKAVDWLNSRNDLEEKSELVRSWASIWGAGSNLGALVNDLNWEGLPDLRNEIVGRWAGTDGDRFESWIKELPDEQAKEALTAAMNSEQDNYGLSLYAERFGNTMDRSDLFEKVVRVANYGDPKMIDGLQQAMESLPEGDETRDSLERALEVSKLGREPNSLQTFLEKHGATLTDQERTAAFKQAASGAQMGSNDGILRMAENLGVEDRSDFLIAALTFRSGGLEQPEAVMAIAESWLQIEGFSADPIVSEELGAQVARKFTLSSDTRWNEGAEWAMQVSNSKMANAAMTKIVADWSDYAPSEAAAWLHNSNLPVGPLRDAAIGSLVPHVVDSPETAMQWIGTITDRDQRIHSATGIVMTWSDLAPDRARLVLSGSGLSASDIAAVAAAAGIEELSPNEL